MGQYSGQGHAPFAFLDGGEHFQGEGGEGGKGTTKARDCKQAPLRRQRCAMDEVADQQADEPATGEVGHQGAIGNSVITAVEPEGPISG